MIIMPTLGAVIRQLRDDGWTPRFGDNEVRLALGHRAIWVYGDGRVELEDRRELDWADARLPVSGDPRWAYAFGILGLDRSAVDFEPRTRRWASSLPGRRGAA